MAWTLVVGALLGGCGYRFVGDGPGRLPGDYQALSVLEFENRSAEIQLGSWCSRALQDAVVNADRRLAPPEEADLILDGVVVAVVEHPLAFAGDAQRPQLEMEAEVQLAVAARSRGREVFRDRGAGRGRYTATGTPGTVDAQRRRALRRACVAAVAQMWTAMEAELEQE
ncbi:MAG: LPS assembly lipoprotein LptE [Myxococcota bacterium]